MMFFETSWLFQARHFITGLWPILWHSTVALSLIAVLVLIAVGTIALQGIIGADAMVWVRRVAFIAAGALAIFWIGMTVQYRSDVKAEKKQEEITRRAGIKQATVSRKRAVRAVARGVCDQRDTDCAKRRGNVRGN